jgi:hypothetical protein
VHVSDAVLLCRLALEKGQAGARYHAVGGEGATLRGIAAALNHRAYWTRRGMPWRLESVARVLKQSVSSR